MVAASIIWKSLLLSQKNIESLEFKASIKKWKPINVQADFIKHIGEL